jgi:hypothetical protein
MSRKLIGLAVVAAVAGGTALATASVGGGGDSEDRWTTVTIDLSQNADRKATSQRGLAGSKKKPRLVYLQGQPTEINPADPSAGGFGPNIDVKLTGCSKVVEGGVVVTNRLDVYVQGSYVRSKGEYHVRIALDQNNLADRTPFTITSNLTCLKGVK